MFRSRARTSSLLVAALFVAGACSSTGTTASRPPSIAPSIAPSAAPATGTPSRAPSAPPAASATSAPAQGGSGDTGDQARVGDWSALEPCDLLAEEAAATVIGSLSGDPVRADGALGGKSCTWTDEGGGTLRITTADPTSFESMRESATGAQDVPRLGSGAYFAQDGDIERLVVHGGAVVLVIEASEGREVSEAAARAILAVLEVL
jgi:hypothetical protein